ncbi:hypothetical protein RM572_08465 [Streptomyces sp. DSM 42041]|uniref:Lipoprotein n=1 Tax=Streptomyces hazeniae TaxID=3075538 RepID=A0ABU2NP98_9ACTN|nr:hypothetical protein [Streptomyces sp. DSM 42041]MDT0378806.1 hypothetical protein [Streptomyces sp. DSM 42041]
MPSTTPGGTAGPGAPTPRSGPPRRALLAGAVGATFVAGTTAGCTNDGESPEERRRRVDATRRLRRAAAADSQDLLTRYTSTAAVHPALGGLLAPLREAVARHLEAFSAPHRASGGQDGGAGEDRKGGGGESPAGGPPAGNRTAVPGDEKRALTALAEAERRTAGTRMRDLVDAPPELARLLASVAAAGSAHALLLTEGDAA